MTPLRQRMIEDMRLRNLSPKTVEAYVGAVARFAKHFGRSPEQIDAEQVRQYLLHLVEHEHASWSRYNQTRCALQFLYSVTLGQDQQLARVRCARTPRRLPTVLSRDEVRRLLETMGGPNLGGGQSGGPGGGPGGSPQGGGGTTGQGPKGHSDN